MRAEWLQRGSFAYFRRHRRVVGMGDETAGAVEHERVARLTDTNRRDHVPDQLEIDRREGDVINLARAGNGRL